MKAFIFSLIVLALVECSSAVGQTILRVNQTASGSQQDGQSWATAFTRLEDAIAAAQPTASQTVEIWVAKGTYKPTSGTDRSAAFRLKSHLVIRGGFRGNETTTSERTPWGNPTILSGDIGAPMVGAITALNPEPAQLPSTADAGWADNCYNVLVGEGVEDVTLEFLTVTGGSATDPAIDAVDIDGFEMYSADPDEEGAKSNVKPSSTVVGGGLFFTTGRTWTVARYGLQMYNCTFARNRARGYGGAVGVYDASAFIGGCDFEQNVSSGPAGAFWGLNQQSGFVECTFTDNSAADGGGAVKIMGIPSDRASDANIDGFTDTLRGVAFSIFGVTEEQTQKRIGSVLTSYGIYKAANKFAATEGGFFAKAGATIPNPFVKSTTNVGGSVVQDTSISPATRVLAVYALVQIAVGVGDNIVKILDAFGKIDHDDQNYKNWVSFNTYFNQYATPQGLLSLGAHAVINAALPSVQPDLIGTKKSGYTYYTQAGRSGFASCSFTGNEAGNEGGAIELIYNNLLIENCRFERNSAAKNGGAISSALWNMPQVISSVFSNNTSVDGTSAISNSFNSLMMAVNCTIVNNRSSDPLGKAVTAAMGADVRIYNSILWGNGNGAVRSGADVEAVTEDMLDENAHKRYDVLQGEKVNWLGYMDIRNSIIQSLATLPLGTDRIAPQLAGTNLSQSEINAAIAVTKEADVRGELESTGAVNVGAGIREKVRDPSYGNSAADPMLLATPLGKTSSLSPATNAGNNQWITWKMISHAVPIANIIDVAGSKRVLDSRVDIGAYEVDNTRPDSAPLAGADVDARNPASPEASGVGAGAIPTVSPTTPPNTAVYYVKPAASGDGSGSSWANATGDLQSAISHANAEVWVAAGTYKPTSGTDRTISFSLASGVKVFGGFAGSETTRSARNWKTNTTIISGDIGSPNVVSDNSKNLFKNAGLTSSAVLDGFTLQDANSSDADGGAMLNTDAAPLLQNCVFRNNHARNGGAIYSSGTGDVGSVLVNCEFRDNSAESAGGAVGYTHSLLGNNLIFSGNTAGAGGGAISVSGSSATQYCTIQNGLFYGNSSTAAAGGAIATSGLYLNVANSTFYGNAATIDSNEKSGGGAIDDGYSSPSGLASALVVNSIFYKNTTANQGGGGVQTLEKQQIQTAGSVLLSHSLVQGLNSYAGNVGQANFSGDPQFVAEGSDFHLQDTSLAIDSGDATSLYTQILTTDLDGGSRTINGAMDLGPYEHSATTAHPVRSVAETSTGTESFTFTAAYTATLGDTLRWQVDRGDGLGYVPLTEGEENAGVFTATLTVSSRPNGFSYRLQVVRNGVTYFSPVTTLEPTAASIFKYIYVKPVATGDGSGTSWANATSDLRSAVGQPSAEVWVAAGTYKPTSGTDRDISFSLGSATKVYGGFVGTETKLEARDWRANQTIVSGEIGGAGVEDNTRHLFRNTGVGNSAVLDGFYLQDAYADGVDGGAILNINSNPAIQNCVFESNHARNGGAICSTGTDIAGFGSKVFNCEFRGNSAELAGGAIHFDGSWAGANLLFEDNTAPTGGAVYSAGDADGRNVTVQNALFTDNAATDGAGGAVWASGLSLYVINSTLYANQATVDSAGAAAGGAIAFDRATSNTATLGIYNSILYKNTALNYGAGGRDSVEKQQISLSAGSLAGVKSSLVQGLQAYTGNGNFDGDPVFVNEGTDFHVANTSPTIESGTLDNISSRLETTDLDGNNRIIGAIDLGPYEHAATPANPIRKITASSAGLESYSYTAADYSAQAGDTLQWYVDRGNGDGFVVLGANDSGQDALPDEYLGVNTASLTVLSPPSGFLFRLKLVRNGDTYYSPVSRLSPTALSKTVYFYVRPEATGDGSGSGWTNATSDLQAAISQPNAQVWVQEGTYYPTSGTDRDASFSLARGVRVYGGFRGTESLRDARNAAGHPTRISGNIGSPSDAQDNSRHLFRNEDIGASTVLDGFTLEDAYADGEDGGAILNVSASPTIQHCIFRNNYARNGGAIASTGTPSFLFGSDLVDCRFENNTAELTGGAISYNCSLSAVNVVFDGNKAGAGGAMNFEGNSAGQSVTVRNGLFVDNRARDGRGGAIFSQGLSLWIENSTFHGNQANLSSASPLGGGAIYQDYTSYGTSTVQVYNSIFYGNAAANSGSGGLASLEYQQIAVKGSGGIYASHSLIQGLNRYANIAQLANFDDDPQFVDAGRDFRLSSVSPAINSGVDSEGGSFLLADTDLDGNARVHLDAVDLGPYEYAGAAALGRITSSSDFSSGTLRFFKTAGFAVQAGDVLQWQVDRGDGSGFVPLKADGVYSGVDTATLSITSPPSSANGYQFRLQVVRGGDTLTTLSTQLTLPLSRIYVDASRLEMTADGADWSTAYGSLADALKASAPGSVLWVAGGTYLPTSGLDANAAFRIPAGVAVYGGFSSGMTSLSQRNPVTHPSILSGKLNGATSRLDYSRHVVVNQGALGRTTLLDGFVLEDAYSSLMVNDGASPTLRNCVFQDNDSSRAGDGYGAAISNINGANPLIAECQFLGNTAVYAGALYLSGASATVENSVFARNHASASGGAIFVRNGSLSLIHCTVADNTSQGTVAALYEEASAVTVANSIFWNNQTSYAGWTIYDRAIRAQGGSLTFSHSCVEGGASLPATNLTYDPIFDPSQGGDYALAPYSPLVNAASADVTVSSSTDLAGNPRVHESAPDVGAYELQTNATAAVLLTSLPRSRIAYNIGGTVDFTVSWPSGSTLNPTWYLLDANSTPLNPSRYTLITGSGFSTVRVKDINLADTGLAVSFTDYDRGVNSIPPAVLTVHEPRIVRVNPAATGNNDGTSWTDAYTDLITALNNAQTADEIWVAGGTYTAGGASYFNLGSAVSLYGGFAGTETTRSERDPVSHPTRLHAVGTNPVLYSVTPGSGSGVPTTVDGFIVENSTGPAAVMNVGVSATYRNCVFRDNAGYIGNFQSQVQYDRCEFTGNTGNLFISDRSTVTLGDCNLHDNTTTVDLMTSSNHSTVVFSDTVVSGNTVAGALFRNSGGAEGGSLLTVLRSAFRGNTTGGAIIDNSSVGTCAIESSLFAGNVASASFATLQNSGALSIVLSTFADNRGGWFGGGLATYSTSVTSINSCIFWGNRGARANATIEAQQVGDRSGTLTVKQSIIEGLATFTNAGDHNTAYYPLFADPAAGDYHLLANSPAIDTAEPHLALTSALDLDQAPRPIIYGDAGAYEFPGTPGTPLMISTYPSYVTTTETTTTGFTIVAPAFSGYRWQFFDGTNWVDVTNTSEYQVINSETSDTSTLQFDSPSLALNGTRYRLILTTAGITYTTGDLILTVNRPRVLHVNGAVSASGDGSSWATAFKTVQEALVVTDENAEIWVQAGTYAINTANLKWNVHLYGGFAGDETQRSERDWTTNVVTLLGNGKRIFTNSDPVGQKTSHAVLDGFTLAGATSQTAVFLDNSDAVISHCTFRENASAIGVSGYSNPVITDCVFASHTATVLVFDGDSATVSGCTFQNNSDLSTGASGSTIYIYRGNVTIADSSFTGNVSSGGLVAAAGDFDATSAANVAAGKVTQLTMSRCRLTENTAYAGIVATQVLLNLDNSLIAQNTLTGSAVWGFSRCLFNLTNLTVVDNTGTFDCAGIQCDGPWTLKNSIVWGNRTSWPYGSLVHPDSSSLVEDVQIKLNSSTSIKNSTIEGAYYTTLGGNPNANSGYDPLFADAGAGDYQLSAISPAVNAGTAAGIPSGTLDLASQPRLSDATPDMGAYEFTGTAGTAVRMSSNLGAKKLIVGQGIPLAVQVPAGVNVQWQVNTGGSFVDVVSDGNHALSADGKTLTLSNASLAMNGNQYRFVLSGGVSYTSAAGLLTVVPKPIIHVDATATGNNDGTSWADAFVSLDDALIAASNPVTGGPCEVWVAQGTYVSDQSSVPPGVELYGGFAGGETARSERNLSAQPTLLTSPAGSDTRSYVLSDGYPDSAQSGIVIDGFTLTGPSSGIEISTGPAVVRNCTFTSLAGYGVAVFYVPLTVEDCVFEQPGVEAVLAGPASKTAIRRSTFQAGLTASSSGEYPANVSIEDSVFQNNTAGHLDATLYVSEGSTVNMTRCRVLKNHGDAAIKNDGTLLIRQSLIADNFGAGVDLTYRALATQLTSVTVANNASHGIGIGWQNSSLRLTNCIIAGNHFRQQIYTDSGGVFASYTLVQGETYSGTGNQSWDPLFVNPAAGDYTLAPHSPGIDAGNAAAVNAGETDLAGSARIQSGAPDLGAYESALAANPLYRGPLPASVTTPRGVDGVFSITGASSYTYTWQYYDGSAWVDITFDSETNSWVGPAGVPIAITTVNGVSTLTIPKPTLSASGLQFRVTIDEQGVTSDPFTLTVNEPEILYVDASVAASGDGKTWGTAFKTLSEALAQVIPSRRILYVAAGTYRPAVSGYDIRQRVEIYGGFPAGGAAFEARDAAANRVILSGELGDPGSTADNASPVVGISALNSPIGADTILDGLTVDGGRVGISVTYNASPTLRTLVVSHNVAGGLAVTNAGAQIEDSRFLENSNPSRGGGANLVSSAVTFSRCVFRGNSSELAGGGLEIFNGSVRVESTVISGNKSVGEGGGIDVAAGSHTLVNSTVVGNSAGSGGGLYVYIGCNLNVWNSILWANRASQGTREAQQLDKHLFGGGYNVQASDIEGLSQYAGSNLAVDPLFYSTIDAANAPTTAGDFHVYGGSPVVDQGSDALLDGLSADADNAPRSVRTVDLGAYEVQGAAGDPLQITQQPADLVYEEDGTNEYHIQLAGSDYTYQWESSTDGSVFTPVADGADFAGSQTAALQVLTGNPAQQGTVFRVTITSPAGGAVVSRSALFSFYPSVYYVNAAAADDNGDGYTWDTAFKTIGTALQKVRISSSGSVQIWVASGTYSPSETDPAASFAVMSNVELYGGFAGTETALEQRDVAAHPTLLQGIAGSAAVFASSGTDPITGGRIDGFAINTATTGISLGHNVTLTVANCSFSELENGIAGDTDTLTVENCQFTGLTTSGITNYSRTTNVADSVFAENGVGILQVSGSLNVVRTAFRGNGVPTANGGGVSLNSVNATIESCLFSGNYSRRGSGLYAMNGDVAVRNCTFAGNYAGFAAGLYYQRSGGSGTLQLTNSILWGNAISGSNPEDSQFYYDNAYSSTRLFYNNDVQAYRSYDFSPANGNISVDPQFVSPVAASAAATTAGDYQLTVLSSAVINQGSNAHLGASVTDLAQSPRTVDTTVDLGAYEFPKAFVAVTTQPQNAAAGIGHATAVYSVASNSSEATYQWQVSLDGGNTWTDLVESVTESGITTATLTVAGGPAFDGRLYRVKITSPESSVYPGVVFSNAALYHYVVVIVSPPSEVRNATLTGTTSTISFTVAGGALSASILDGSFAIHAMQTGRLSLADGSLTGLTVTGDTVSLQSTVPFKAGELVEVTTTSAIQRTDGYFSDPLVYQFHAANQASSSGISRPPPPLPMRLLPPRPSPWVI